MKTDRELLELAARAAGYELNDFAENGAWAYQKGSEVDFYGELPIFLWSPLTDDGDALRLAAAVATDIQFLGDSVSVSGHYETAENDDYMSAVRRAIVRAAAAIGETL